MSSVRGAALDNPNLRGFPRNPWTTLDTIRLSGAWHVSCFSSVQVMPHCTVGCIERRCRGPGRGMGQNRGMEQTKDAASTQVTFVGRRQQRAALEAGLRGASGGHGGLYLIEGEAGIGKTRLAATLAQAAVVEGMAQVAWGRCWAGGGAPAFWPWRQVVRRLAELDISTGIDHRNRAQEIEVFFDSASEAADDADRFPAFETMARLLHRVSSQQPLIVILDDLHAADVPSLRLLHFVARYAAHRPLLLIATYVDSFLELDPDLCAIMADIAREGQRLSLHGLSAQEITSLIDALGGHSIPADLQQWLHSVTEGNPLLIEELTRWLAASHTTRDPALLPAELPGHVRAIVRRQLRGLPDATLRFLVHAAHVGCELDARAALARSPLPAGDDASGGADPLALARRLRILVPSGTHPGRYRFRSELLHEALRRMGTSMNLPVRQGEEVRADPTTLPPPEERVFRREGELWRLTFQGHTCLLGDSKGLSYLAQLLRQPGRQIPCPELVRQAMGRAEGVRAEGAVLQDHGVRIDGDLGDAGERLDAQAQRAYKQHLLELRAELAEAEACHDPGRVERLRKEIEVLSAELCSALGYGGRKRRAGSHTERARVNVHRAISTAIRRIEPRHPALARHLLQTIRTGTCCHYQPDPRVNARWEVSCSL